MFTLNAMSSTYRGIGSVVDNDAETVKLHEAGVFDKAEAFFDALENGGDVLTDSVDPDDLIKRAKALRPS